MLADGATVEYDVLVLALGASPLPAVPGALTFSGLREDSAGLARLLEQVTSRELRRLVFAVPAGSTWPLPLYELALLTGEYLAEHLTHAELMVVTPEEQALGLFGEKASEAMALLLATRGIGLRTATAPVAFADGVLGLVGGGTVAADAVVALPLLEGSPLGGIPQDEHGFVPTDEFGRVAGLTDVYAAGDLTQSSIKQGGIAAQEADAVAEAIAADAGAPVHPSPCRPVPPRTALHRLRTTISAARGRRGVAGRHAAAVVAAGQDRRPLPEPVPRRASRPGGVRPTSRGRATDRGRSRPSGRHAGLSYMPIAWKPLSTYSVVPVTLTAPSPSR